MAATMDRRSALTAIAAAQSDGEAAASSLMWLCEQIGEAVQREAKRLRGVCDRDRYSGWTDDLNNELASAEYGMRVAMDLLADTDDAQAAIEQAVDYADAAAAIDADAVDAVIAKGDARIAELEGAR